jgi:uncharacterized protein (TIGR02453 family)
MGDEIDLKPVLAFLSGLEQNNNKPWFEANRAAYETARSAFVSFVDELIGDFGRVEDLKGIAAKDCVMRIYRDMRFSKDKTPYKINMSASIGPGGKKSPRLSYYFHLQPHGESMVAGGLHMPEPAQLNKFRAAIARNARPFKSVITAPSFRKYFGDLSGEKLKSAPQGYDRAHPEIELLRLKEVVAVHHIPDAEVLAPKFRSQVVGAFTAMKPFLDYLNSVVL